MPSHRNAGWNALAVGLVILAAGVSAYAVDWLPYDHAYLDHVGTWAHGPCGAVATRGDVVLYGDGPTLHVLRLAADGSATEVATMVLDVPPAAIAIGDGVAYVACSTNVSGTRPLYAISILNPERPYITHRIDGGGMIRDLFVDGSRLYAAAVRLRIYDLADPRRPEQVAEADVGYAAGVAARDGLAYVAARGSGVAVVDVSDPAAPVLLGHVTGAADVNFRDVEILDDHLLIADSDYGLRCFSLADPAQPVLTGSSAAYNLVRVAVAGSVAFTAAQGGGVRAFDVQDPAHPTQLDMIGSAWCNALAAGDGLLLLAGEDEGLEAFAIGQPDDLSLAWRRQTAAEALDVAVQGDLLCVADGWAGLVTVDISDPRNPRELGRYRVGNGYMESVALQGDLAYVLSKYAFNNRLYVIDVSDPTSPFVRDSLAFSSWASGLDVVGDRIFVANGYNGLQIVLADDPDNLHNISTLPLSFAADVVVRGSLAYVAAGHDGMVIVDVADSTNPMIIGSFPTIDSTPSLDVEGDVAFLGVAFEGIAIVDISDPTQPTSLAYADSPWSDNILSIEVLDGMAYTSGDSSPAVKVVDVSDPYQPIIVESPESASSSHKLVADAGRLYVASRAFGVEIFVRHGPPPAGVDGAVAHRCYPNPCNPQTSIEFELARAGAVQVEVYDVAGRRVARPWLGALPTGRHLVAWDGRTDSGSPLASGTYLYRIGTATGKAVGKIQLVR